MLPLERDYPDESSDATGNPDRKRRSSRFSLGRVLLLVFVVVVLAGLLYAAEEIFVDRKVNAACQRIADLSKVAPGGHIFQNEVQSAIGFAPSSPMIAVNGDGQEEYVYQSLHNTYTIRVTYWDWDNIGKPYVARIEVGTRWKF